MRGLIVFSLVLSVACLTAFLGRVILGAGIGLSGPDQVLEMEQGKSGSSYVVVWNAGDSTDAYRASIYGNITAISTVQPQAFTLDPSGSRTLTILYAVPADQQPGTYAGRLVISSDDQLSSSVSKTMTVKVKQGARLEVRLKAGTNLIGWVGADLSFGEALGNGRGPTKVWRRNTDGSYVSAQYYSSTGVWWSADGTFTGLRYGAAYFVECQSDCVLTIQPRIGPTDLYLEAGTNLIVWKSTAKPFAEAFPQSPANCPVRKVWRRTVSGEYEYAEYYPSVSSWWSPDPSFVGVEKGGAYFVESLGSVTFQG